MTAYFLPVPFFMSGESGAPFVDAPVPGSVVEQD